MKITIRDIDLSIFGASYVLKGRFYSLDCGGGGGVTKRYEMENCGYSFSTYIVLMGT